MTAPITINVPGDPRGKGRPRFGHGAVYTDKKTVAFEQSLAWAAKLEMAGRDPFSGPVIVTIGAYMPIPLSWNRTAHLEAISGARRPSVKPDADNIAKAVLDALNGVVFHDDKQVVEMMVMKKYGVQPSTVVTVREA